MIENISVQDFQSIESGKVDLGKFTVFTGPSSSGKSAFLRALHGLTRNSFNPSQVRLGQSVTTVSAIVDGRKVEAVRGKSKSTYKLDDEEYTKAGRAVPEDVEAVLSMPLVADLESSFATQFDKPYLIADPGSTGAKVLGTLTNVSVLHDGMREANRRKLSINAEIKVRKADLEKDNEEVEQYADLTSLEESISKAEDALIRIQYIQRDATEVDSLVDTVSLRNRTLEQYEKEVVDLSAYSKTLEEVTSDLHILSGVDGAVNNIQILKRQLPTWKYKDVPSDMDEAERLIAQALELDTITSRIESLNKNTPDWDYTAVPSSDRLDTNTLSDLRSLDRLLTDMVSSFESLKMYTMNKKKASIEVERLESELHNILEGVDMCPLCNTPL